MVALAGLMTDYLRETFQQPWRGTVDSLTRDVLGKEAHALLAVDQGEPIGFALWRRTWDARRCVAGGELLDVFVQREFRGGAFAPELLLATVADVAKDGGVFLRGQELAMQGDRLYQRFAMTQPGTEFTLSGRAFRELAALDGQPLREVLRALPPRSANLEP
jgi:GNAT superfamily N-acetyltransferase